MYGYERKWLLLAELIEHYRIQGIDHFYLYIKDMDNYTFKLIKYYEKIGIAEVIRFREYNDRPGQEWQLVGTQDCLQRSRHHSRYAIFQDLDERIVPAGDVKLRNLIKETMEISGKIAMISFVGERVERTSRVPLEYKVLLMWVHHVEVYFPGYTGYELPPEKAILRHYRDLTRANLTRRLRPITHWFMYTKIGYPAKLMPLLYRQVETTLNQVYTVSNQTTNLNI
ncbi:hypothetical protein NECAME_09128 [Necator americanus]|uniref:Glycosyltransferase family 92 protein n=1 Tax=Necator americanus TaxID=51031 RepID=W2TFY4_NECAM|nr:hypothetical protein NECAME_09128 [Necator americanus]ETN80504.1 hypothetical protein NECAME_09128 [Necator americanus]